MTARLGYTAWGEQVAIVILAVSKGVNAYGQSSPGIKAKFIDDLLGLKGCCYGAGCKLK